MGPRLKDVEDLQDPNVGTADLIASMGPRLKDVEDFRCSIRTNGRA